MRVESLLGPLILLVALTASADQDVYQVGVGIGDCTGPAAQINMMGYAKLGQDTHGLHLRQFARAFIIGDNDTRVVIVSVDAGMISQILKMEVVRVLGEKYNGLYTNHNVLVSGTHTHSTPGGFFQYTLFDITSSGFINQTFEALLNGVVASIDQAHKNMQPAYIFYGQDTLLNASANRSPASYLENPKEERDRYDDNTDKTVSMLKFVDLDGNPIGLLDWFAVHCTSMNNTNELISSDNKGYAALLVEMVFNNGTIGKGPFVAGFPNANEGDSSPNTEGAKCIDTGLPCDFTTSTCDGRNELCIASGPGKDMLESTEIIAKKQFVKAEYAKNQNMYLSVRNLIVILWNVNPKKWLTLDDVTPYTVCRGLVRVRFILETQRALKFMTVKGIINTGLLSCPLEEYLVNPAESNEHVIVIGAGTAGIGAARQLTNFGIKVTVLEAKSRIGGRVSDDGSFGVCVGKGAQIVTGVINNPITLMCIQADFPMKDVVDRCELYSANGGLTEMKTDSGVDQHFNAMLESVSEWRRGQSEDVSLEEKLLEVHEQFLKESNTTFSEEQMKILHFNLGNLEYACGSSLRNVSALYWDQNEAFAQFAGPHSLLPMGYMVLLKKLAEGLDIRLDTPVTGINYEKDGVIVTTKRGDEIKGTRVLVTVPVAVLKRNVMTFNPPLPVRKSQAIAQMGAGLIEKIILHFPERFWDKKIQGADFFGCTPPSVEQRGRFGIFYDMNNNPEGKGPHVLMTCVCGDNASIVSTKKDKDIVKKCMEALCGIFTEPGTEVPEPLGYIVTRWVDEPYIHMVYSFVQKGSSGDAYDDMAEEVDDKIFFAGEATNRHFPQTVTGAYLSAVREASKIVQLLI